MRPALPSLFAALLLTVAAPAIAASATFAPRDVFALEQATDVQISPDGRHVAYVRSSGDIMTDGMRKTVWLIDTATGVQSPLLDGVASRPRWSPDGTRVAYVTADGGKPQLFVHWLASGRNARITGLADSPATDHRPRRFAR